MVKEIHVAIIGAGYWGFKLIREYLELSREDNSIKVSAIVDISRERLIEVSKKLQLPDDVKLYTSIEPVGENSEIEAVHIATPNETHYQIASYMLNHEKHVLVEKPMTLSSREAFKLARMAELNKNTLLVGHIFRFNEAIRKAKHLIHKNNERILYMNLTWATKMPPPQNRDIIFDLAPHPIDIINFLTDEWPIEVYVTGKSYVRNKQGLEEVAFSLLKLPKDMLASIKISWIEYGPKTRHVKIVTNNSAYFIDALNQTLIRYTDNYSQNIELIPSNTMREMIKHFIDIVRYGGGPSNSALIGALTVVVLEAMRESLLKDKVVKIL